MKINSFIFDEFAFEVYVFKTYFESENQVAYYTSVQKKCTPVQKKCTTPFWVFKRSACFGLNLEFI